MSGGRVVFPVITVCLPFAHEDRLKTHVKSISTARNAAKILFFIKITSSDYQFLSYLLIASPFISFSVDLRRSSTPEVIR